MTSRSGRSAIRITSMTDSDDVHEPQGVVDGIEDAEVTGADPPEIGGPLKLAAAFRPWVISERLYSCEDSGAESSVEPLEFLTGRTSEGNRVLIHELGVYFEP